MSRRGENLAWLHQQFRPLRHDERERPAHPVVVGAALPFEEMTDEELEELVQGIKAYLLWVLVRDDPEQEEFFDQ